MAEHIASMGRTGSGPVQTTNPKKVLRNQGFFFFFSPGEGAFSM